MPDTQPVSSAPITVDSAICASFGRCSELEPDAITFDDRDQAVPTAAAEALSEQRIRDLIEICPTGAIRRTPDR
jgi:ferredoxin